MRIKIISAILIMIANSYLAKKDIVNVFVC